MTISEKFGREPIIEPPIHVDSSLPGGAIIFTSTDSGTCLEISFNKRSLIPGKFEDPPERIILPHKALSYVPEAEGNSVMEKTTIDEFVGVIKIDIEGYEMEVLEGTKETIVDQKLVLLLGIYHNPKEFFEAKQFVQDLKPEYNFKFKILSDLRPIAESYIIAW